MSDDAMSDVSISHLQFLTDQFIRETGLLPQVSAEIEFYLPQEIPDIAERLKRASIETYGLEKERGENQYELALKNPALPVIAAEQVATLKRILPEADFRAKPYPDRPGSGLHIHISLINHTKKHLFAKENGEESPALRHAIAGLLATLPEAFVFFAPMPESYARFTAALNNQEPGEGRYNNAPVNVSWGGNNRTTAIRIPASSAWPEGRHIEHRVAGADADPATVIAAILLGVQHGLKTKSDPGEKIFGNAYDKQYAHLPRFPKSLEEAQELYNKGGIIRPNL